MWLLNSYFVDSRYRDILHLHYSYCLLRDGLVLTGNENIEMNLENTEIHYKERSLAASCT